MTKSGFKEKAIALRKEGLSYNLIQEQVPVSKSTLSLWLAEIPYTPNQKVAQRISLGRAKSGEIKSRRKQESLTRASRVAKENIGVLTQRDLFILGLGLYIGEGEKGDRGITRIVNSDPRIITLAIYAPVPRTKAAWPI